MDFKENALTAEVYRGLRASVGWVNLGEEQTERGLERSLFTLAVFDGEKAVGMGRIVGDGIYNVICDVVVAPDYQGRGVGTEIVQRLLGYLNGRTPEGGRASVQLIAETAKEPFYEKLGFEVLPSESSGSGMRLIIKK